MVKLNRTTEYGLIALRYMMAKQTDGNVSVTSARELADRYELPFEITAKTLQRMRDSGLIESAQGARGGYTLHRSPAELNVAEFLELMEGRQAVVECCMAGELGATNGKCEYRRKCDVKGAMTDLNERIRRFLGEIRLTDLEDFKKIAVAPIERETQAV